MTAAEKNVQEAQATSLEAFKVLEASAMETINAAKPVVYEDHQMGIGDSHAQGDILITRVAKRHKDCVLMENPDYQLAPGETQGSRHIIQKMDGIRVYKLKDGTVLDGPTVECDSPMTINHPEHKAVTVPAGTYIVTYQKAWADELRRVRD